ncbi:MAG: hypothetical protein KF729_35500 [Sandaracinaceae bacterium]|nr:hypothetical protein [Sandaracinaceae bacterium]
MRYRARRRRRGGEPGHLCELCHLEGEHGGRLRVRGTASHLEWWIGRTPALKIHGREVTRRR